MQYGRDIEQNALSIPFVSRTVDGGAPSRD